MPFAQHHRSERSIWFCATKCCCLPRPLRSAPRELWVVLAIKLLGSLAYFASSLVFVPYLREEFGYSDVEAGMLYGLWGFLASVMGLVCGPVIDCLGIKKSLVVGSLLGVAGGVVLSMARSRAWAILSITTLLPVSMSLGIPVLTIGVKRYTSTGNSDIAYGIFYSVMNVGAVIAGPCVDAVRFTTKGGVAYAGYTSTYSRLVFMLAGIVTMINAMLAASLIRDVKVLKNGTVYTYTETAGTEGDSFDSLGPDDNEIDDDDVDALDAGSLRNPGSIKPTICCSKGFKTLRTTFRDRFFWRLAVFSLCMTPVNMIFRHLDATLPTWLLRTIGDDVAFGTLYIVDPLCVIFLTLIFPFVLRNFDVYKRMIFGSLISAGAVFLLAMQASAFSVVLFGIVLSVGESIYSPLIYAYTMGLTPEGKEGSYSALSSAPLFTTKLFVGWISGSLLSSYCPSSEDSSQCAVVWLWVGGIALLSPLMLFVSMRFVHDSHTKIRIDAQRDGRDRDEEPVTLLDRVENGIEAAHNKLIKSSD